MPADLSISIILCTRNRAPALEKMLVVLGRVKVPHGWKVEVILVDNGSTDNTAAVAQEAKLETMQLKYLLEPKKGKANALNSGLAMSRGEIILFMDDDVLVAPDWLEQIVLPILKGQCDAVTGQITLAPELLRPWMTPKHRWWLASSRDAQLHEGSRELIGANMGFHRSVLKSVPAFDPEVGPGARGLGEDSLFGWQLVEAGYKIEYVPKAAAIHQPDASRLRRFYWLDDARKRGRSDAYLAYHWEHVDIQNPRLTWLWLWLKLWVKRILQPPPKLQEEGCPRWEMGCIWRMELCKQFCLDRRHPRNYARRGLKRLLISKNVDAETQNGISNLAGQDQRPSR
jgi:glycosyltransferase involved in cell wall biosynthesis